MEHLLFKVDKSEHVDEHAKLFQDIEVDGGSLNAITDKETTCFYARIPHQQVADVTEKLIALLFQPVEQISQNIAHRIDSEKQIILQEIQTHKQRPEGLIVDPWVGFTWPNHGLGQPVIGTVDSVTGLSTEVLTSCYQQLYRPKNLILSISGRFDANHIQQRLNTCLVKISPQNPINEALKQPTPPIYQTGQWLLPQNTASALLCIGGPSLTASNPRRYQLSLLDTWLGSGMNSRLFQQLRQQQALVYGINTFQLLYRQAGLFGIVAQTQPSKLQAVYNSIIETLDTLCQSPLNEAELNTTKRKVLGNLLMNLESPRYRAARNARSLIYQNQLQPLEYAQEAITNTTPNDLQQLAQSLFDPYRLSLAIMAPENTPMVHTNLTTVNG